MKVEIITIGNELLIGHVENSNASWIARELTKNGFQIEAITTIGDHTEDIIKAIDIAFNRADILLVTGGVGPTKDDVTKHALCQYFHTALEFNDDVLKNIESIFIKRNIQLNQLTRNQAYVPVNSTVIQNRLGTAPILWFDKGDKVLISMPGVPYEMKHTVKEDILPLLKKKFNVSEYNSFYFTVTGITESALATQLAEFELELPADISLAYFPSLGYILLQLSVWGEEHLSELKLHAGRLKKIVGPHLVSENEKTPEVLLGDLLRKKLLTVSTAESCTGGHISHKITVVPGASDYYTGSIISYDTLIKEEQLDVDKKTIDLNGVVSKEVVEQMALNVAGKFHTNCSIAVSGIMGPNGGTKSNPVGTVWVATLYNNKIKTQEYQVGVSRSENIERTANIAILQMIKMLNS